MIALSEREQEILELLADGLSNRQISERLFIAYNTVKWYNKQIYNKLGVCTRAEALSAAHDLRLIPSVIQSGGSPHNLPKQLNEFVGRDLEIARLSYLLRDPNTRLVTLLAPGGMGKTRLALEVAKHIISDTPDDSNLFSDGVCFVSLTPITPENFITGVADQIGCQFIQDGRSAHTQLLDYLKSKSMLLILDNFEHLLAVGSLINEMLQNAPRLKALVTSRELLSLSHETVVTIGGMNYPDGNTPHDVMEYSAVQLFVQSATRAQVQLDPRREEIRHLATICRLVEGMPLGIILAATWVRILSLEEIAEEIRSGWSILESELHDFPQRHHSVRAVFVQSWNMLNDLQQQAFARMSVFRGGCTRQAIQAVTGVSLPTLKALVNKSLVDHSPTGRYSVHELLRQYAQEHLASSGESERIQEAHSRYYLNALRQRERDLKGRRQLAALSEIEKDFENLREAWSWAVEQNKSDFLTFAITALAIYGQCGSRRRDVSNLLNQVAKGFRQIDESLAGIAFVYQALVAGNYHNIAAQVERSLSDARQRNDAVHIVDCLRLLAQVRGHVERRIDEAVRLLQEAFELADGHSSQFEMAITLIDMGYWLTAAQHHQESIDTVTEAYELSRAIGAIHIQARSANFLGTIYANRFGKFEDSERYFREAISLFQNLNALQAQATSTVSLALWVYVLHQGDLDGATRLCDEAWMIASPLGDTVALAQIDIVRALIAGIQEKYVEACSLFKGAVSCIGGEKYKMLQVECGLAMVYCGLGELQTAESYVRNVISFFLHNFRYFAIAVAACIRAKQGRLVEAIELSAFVLESSVNARGWMLRWPVFTSVQTMLQDSLNYSDYARAYDRGRSLNLNEVTARLLTS